jgi:hypothetical protein
MVASSAKPPVLVGDCFQVTLKGEIVDFPLRVPRLLVESLCLLNPPVKDLRPVSGSLD